MGEAARERRPRRLDAAARDLGFPTTASMKKWCIRKGISFYKEDKLVFVDMNQIADLLMGPENDTKPRSRAKPDDIDVAIDLTLAKRRG